MDFPPFVHGMSSTVITSYADGFTLLALARVQPLPRHRNRPENTRGDRAREDFSNANFIPFPSSLVPPSLFFPHLRFLLPSFLPLSFQTAIPSRGIVFTHRRSTRVIADHSCPLPSFTRREKQERERERINEF